VDRTDKSNFIEALKSNLDSASLIVVTKPNGLTVAEVSELRNKMRADNVSFKVVKNSLAKIALKDGPFEDVSDDIKGPIAFAYSVDPVAAARIAVEYAKKNEKFEIVSGCMPNKAMTQDQIKALSQLPSLDELRAKIMAVISTPAQQVASVIGAPARQLAQVVSAYSKKS
jgi:large subunit ribosomal protein L10